MPKFLRSLDENPDLILAMSRGMLRMMAAKFPLMGERFQSKSHAIRPFGGDPDPSDYGIEEVGDLYGIMPAVWERIKILSASALKTESLP